MSAVGQYWAFGARCCIGVALLTAGCEQRSHSPGLTLDPAVRAGENPRPPLGALTGDPAAVAAEKDDTSPGAGASLPRVRLPASAPDLPAQLLACGSTYAWWLEEAGISVHALDSRGKALTRSHSVLMSGARNVIPLGEDSVLVIAEGATYRHYRRDERAARFARIPQLGPLQAVGDPQDIDAFWVRYLRDSGLYRFSLSVVTPVDGTPADTARLPVASGGAEYAVTLGRQRPLPDFDKRWMTWLSDGTPLYSTRRGLMRASDQRISPWPSDLAPHGVWPGNSYHRHWLAGQGGRLVLSEQSRGDPTLRRVSVPGVVLEVVHRGQTLAVLSAETVGVEQSRVHVRVYQEERGVLETSFRTPLSPSERKLDMCLLSGKPWLLVGSTRALRVYDYRRGELLDSWGG